MRVHARSVVAENRLRHEGHGLVVFQGHVFHDVLVQHHLVGHRHELVDFGLAGGGHFVMLRFDAQTAVDHRLHHLIADVHQRVGRRNGKIAFLVAELVAQVRKFLAAAVPLAFDAVDVVIARVRRLIEANVVENEKLALRSDERRIADAGALQIVHRFAGDIPRVARVVFPRDRVLYVADHRQRGERAKRIDRRRFGLGHDEHVALVDRLPTANAGAVEAQAFLEHVLGQLIDGNRKMLP